MTLGLAMRVLSFQSAFFDKLLVRFCGAVVERTRPFITGDFEAAIIAFEKPMVHLVVKSAQCEALLAIDNHSFITGMRRRRGQRVVLQMIDDQQRIGRYHEVNQNRPQVNDMFDRVHR